jgi:hypothetical protein
MQNNPQINSIYCKNCHRPAESHYGDQRFCFPYFLYNKCCFCCEFDGNITSFFLFANGCPECREAYFQTPIRREIEPEIQTSFFLAPAHAYYQPVPVNLEVKNRAMDVQATQAEAFAATRLQALREQEARDREPFEPLNWLRVFIEDILPRPPPSPPRAAPAREPEYLRLQGRGTTAHWWGWQVQDPPPSLL